MRIEVIHPKELGPGEIARWRTLQAGDASLASPYLSPNWAQVVGEARADARVCVLDGGAGFFGVERLSRYSALGLGAPVADYQGVVSAPDFEIDAGALCRALHVGRIDLTHVPAGQAILRGRAAGGDAAWIADVSEGEIAYRAGLKTRRSEFVRQMDKKLRKFEREHGSLRFTALSADTAHFESMLSWKVAQLRRSGQPGIWAKPWVRRVLDRTFDQREGDFGGVLFTLTTDERLIAANYLLRGGRVLHDWIVAHDTAFDAFSPGVQLTRWAVEWAAGNGFAEVDFGPGDYQYKRQLSTGQRQLEWGCVAGLSLSGAVRRAEYALRASVERLPDPRVAALPGKAMRRVDLMRGLGAPLAA